MKPTIHLFDSELLSQAFDLMDFGVMIFKPIYTDNHEITDLEFVYCNQVACDISQFSKEELLGNGLVQLMPGNKEEGLYDKYVEVYTTGVKLDLVQVYGKERIESTVFRIKAKKLNDLLMVYFNDISASKALEKKIKEQKDFFEMAYDFSKDALFIVEVDEQGIFRYSHTNIGHQESTGIPLSTIQGKTPEELFEPELGKRLVNNYQRAVRSEKGISYEETIELPIGTRYYSTTLNPVRNEAGQVIFLIGVAHDISLRKRAEEDLIIAHENLKKTAAQKDKLFSIIAHDMRGPITTSQSLIDLLIESFPSLTKSQIEPYLNLISDGLTQTNNLMQDLLTWAMSQMGGYQVKWDMVFVNKEIESVLHTLKGQSDAKNIQMEWKCEHNVIALLDAHMLRILFRNILSNAIKFTPKNKKIQVVLESKKHYFTLQIKDEGKGMDQATLASLFSAEMNSEYGTEGEKGTGLGLQIVYDFVKRLNGHIEVQSELGKGTTFTLKFDKTKKE